MFFSWRRLPPRGIGIHFASQKPDHGTFPSPKTHVAVYWGRMLPLTTEHRQLATWKPLAFRGEKPVALRTPRAPNRYLAIDSRLTCVLLSALRVQPYGLARFALQKNLSTFARSGSRDCGKARIQERELTVGRCLSSAPEVGGMSRKDRFGPGLPERRSDSSDPRSRESPVCAQRTLPAGRDVDSEYRD